MARTYSVWSGELSSEDGLTGAAIEVIDEKSPLWRGSDVTDALVDEDVGDMIEIEEEEEALELLRDRAERKVEPSIWL
jgi:hypothetical protein